MNSGELARAVHEALGRRTAMLARLAAEGTDCYRLFHGTAEGAAGVTVDRYGDVLLIQSFHVGLAPEACDRIAGVVGEVLPGLAVVYNDRSGANSRIANRLPESQQAAAEQLREVRENGVRYLFRARHDGQDPWLFLDLRAARRHVMALAPGSDVLNLFAYTCGVGIAAAHAGARFVVNIDFAESALRVGRDNARLNALPIRPRFVQSDFFPAIRQLAGLGQPQRVRGRRMPPFPEIEPRRFDLVFLDPPRFSKSPFGVVDLVRDYAALFKPALLATRDGGRLVCCNNVADVSADDWLDQLERSARKAGRALRGAQWVAPDDDFPSFDGQPPLKTVVLEV